MFCVFEFGRLDGTCWWMSDCSRLFLAANAWRKLFAFDLCWEQVAALVFDYRKSRLLAGEFVVTTRMIVVQTKLYSFRFDCKIVSLTAANTNLMFSVSTR